MTDKLLSAELLAVADSLHNVRLRLARLTSRRAVAGMGLAGDQHRVDERAIRG